MIMERNLGVEQSSSQTKSDRPTLQPLPRPGGTSSLLEALSSLHPSEGLSVWGATCRTAHLQHMYVTVESFVGVGTHKAGASTYPTAAIYMISCSQKKGNGLVCHVSCESKGVHM